MLLRMSTVKSFRFRLLTPMILAPAETAEATSASSCASTIAESPRESATFRYSSSVPVSRMAQIRRMAEAPRSFAS